MLGKSPLELMILYDLSIPAGIMFLVSNCFPISINRISAISSADKLPLFKHNQPLPKSLHPVAHLAPSSARALGQPAE